MKPVKERQSLSRNQETPTKRKCACGATILWGWKKCDECTKPRYTKTGNAQKIRFFAEPLADVRWIVVAPFDGAKEDDHFWRTMYEVIAYDSNDTVVDSMEFSTLREARTCSETLCALYGAKMV